MDAVNGIGEGIKKGVESVGNALDTASRVSRGNNSGNTDSVNPAGNGIVSLRQSAESTFSGVKDFAENASNIFDRNDTAEMSEEARHKKGTDEIGANVGEIVSTIKNLATVMSKGGNIGKAGGVGMQVDMIMSAIANDGYINAYDLAPAWVVNMGNGRIGDNNRYDRID